MDTVVLEYEEYGGGNPEPLIILHGFFASSRNWRNLAGQLGKAFHVLVPDLRNHGASPQHRRMDYPALAADVLRFMDEHGMGNANILGHSMGGKVAMWIALNCPGRLRKLIVVDIAPKSYPHRFDKLIRALMDLPLSDLKNRKDAETLLAKDIPDLAHRQFLLQNLKVDEGIYRWRIDLGIFAKEAHNISDFPSFGVHGEALVPFNGDVLFLAGAQSDFLKPQDTLHLFPNSRFVAIANSGHWVHAQQPGLLLEEVGNFCKQGHN